MKKDCEACLKNDRNHQAADCLYCMQYNALIKAKLDDKDDTKFCLNLTIEKTSHHEEK